MTSLWFVVPAHGRVDLTAICLRQLARTCETLADNGLEATAVVIADDENLDGARELGFATVEQSNEWLGMKWNDGYQLACDPRFNPHPADYVTPFGTDDWIDPALLLDGAMPADGEIRCCRRSAVVSEDGRRLAKLTITYPGGDGVRIWPAALLARVGYRPAEEHRRRGIDTSALGNVTAALGRPPKMVYHDLHALQIVDWKSPSAQLNSYAACLSDSRIAAAEITDPWDALTEHYPTEAIEEMQSLYGLVSA
jgi:hypothetical protein